MGARIGPGCLESLASNPAICDRYAELSGNRRKSGEETTSRARQICYLAVQGDQFARQALLEACRYLGIGIANAVWGLDADMVVIDGVLTEAWPLVSTGHPKSIPGGSGTAELQPPGPAALRFSEAMRLCSAPSLCPLRTFLIRASEQMRSVSAQKTTASSERRSERRLSDAFFARCIETPRTFRK